MQDDGVSVTYMFGDNLHKPEIVLKKTYRDSKAYRTLYPRGSEVKVILSNGVYSYEIFSGEVIGSNTWGGINVYKNSKHI